MATIASISTSKRVISTVGRIFDKSSHRRLTVLNTGRYVRLDGNNDYVDAGDVGLTKTLVFWYRMPSTDAEYIGEFSSGGISLKGSSSTLTIGGTTGTIYLNGMQKVGQPINSWIKAIIIFDSSVDMDAVTIGKFTTNYGEIDTCYWEFWSKAFEESDIRNVMSMPEKLACHFSGSSLKLSYLNRYLRMVDGFGTTIYDSSNNDVDATLSGGTWMTGEPNIPQTALTYYNLVGGVMLPQSPDVSTPTVDIQGNALDVSLKGLNFRGEGNITIGAIGDVEEAIVAITPSATDKNILDFDGTHKLAITDSIATDLVVIDKNGNDVTIDFDAKDKDGNDVTLSQNVKIKNNTAVALGWEDQTIFVNGVESGSFTIDALNIISIKTGTEFSATNFQTSEDFEGFVHEIAVYTTKKTDVEDLINYRALNLAHGG